MARSLVATQHSLASGLVTRERHLPAVCIAISKSQQREVKFRYGRRPHTHDGHLHFIHKPAISCMMPYDILCSHILRLGSRMAYNPIGDVAI